MVEKELPGKFHVGYRSVFRFKLKREETARGVAEHYVRDWLGSRKGGADQTALDLWDGMEDTSLPSGANVTVTRFEDERSGRDAVRYQVEDAGQGGGRYRVSVSAMSEGHKAPQVAFLVEVSCDFGGPETAAAQIHPPRLVANILNSRKVFDGHTRLQGQPRVIRLEDLDELFTAIADTSRGAPLLIAASVSPKADEQWLSVIKNLTRTAVGTAAVYVVASEAVDALNARLPEVLKTEPGNLRAVAPRVDMDNPVARRHPLWTPEVLVASLDPTGRPTPEAVAMVAKVPRERVLESPLPADIRRSVQLLNQQGRKKRLSAEVEERVADAAASQDEEVLGAVGEVAAEAAAFPSRASLHHAGGNQDGFWSSFRALLARWLERDAQSITEDTVEEDLRDLDARIVRDRQALQVNEQFLAEVESEQSDLEVGLAELREANDSLAVQLETATRDLEVANQRVEGLEQQLRDLQVAPGGAIEEENGSQTLGELQDKVGQVATGNVDPHGEVGEALHLLAERLDPILQAKMAEYLEGLPWTAVLERIDVSRGREPGIYGRFDPAAQLRMLTERIGKLGFPFEVDDMRRVSTAAQQLRLLRNRWSHYDELDLWDPTRAYDSIHTLLTLLDDDEGAQTAAEKRDALLGGQGGSKSNGPATVSHQPLASTLVEDPATDASVEERARETSGGETPSKTRPAAVPVAVTSAAETPVNASRDENTAGEAQADQPTPPLGATEPPEPPEGLLAAQDSEYEPWETGETKPTELLDKIWAPSNQELVRRVVEDIVAFEAPITLDRLVALVAREFGVNRVHKNRRKDIHRQVRLARVTVDSDSFVWPREAQPESWRGFRRTRPGSDREFLEVSPHEVRNAAYFLLENNPHLDSERLAEEVLKIFDRRRRTRPVDEHLRRAIGDLL